MKLAAPLVFQDGSSQNTAATGGSAITVENVLTSTSTTNALSAAQGKALKDTVDALTSNTGAYYYFLY